MWKLIQITECNIKFKTIKVLEENIRNLQDIELGEIFLDMTQKVWLF